MYYDCGGEWGPVTFPAFKAGDSSPPRVEWWIRLPHASAKLFVIKLTSSKLTPNRALTPIEPRFYSKDARMRLVPRRQRCGRSDPKSLWNLRAASFVYR